MALSIASVNNTNSLKIASNNEKAILEKQLKVFLDQNSDFSLWGDGEKVSSIKLNSISAKFRNQHPQLKAKLEQLKNTSPTFNQKLSKIRRQNIKTHFLSQPEEYLLALLAMDKDLQGKKIEPEIDLGVVLVRLNALRTNTSFNWPVPNKEEGKKIFANSEILSLSEAESLYGYNVKQPRNELVVAGGDASRYRLTLLGLQEMLKNITDPTIPYDSKIYGPFSKNNSVKGSAFFDAHKKFAPSELKKILNSPVARLLGVRHENLRKDNNGNFYALDIKNAIKKIMDNYGFYPKPMDYAYEVNIEGKEYPISFFTNTLISKLEVFIKEGHKDSVLYYMVNDQNTLSALQKQTDYLLKEGIITPEQHKNIRFMDRAKDAIPVNHKTGSLLFINGDLKKVSTGHGTALIRAANFLYKDLKKPLAFSDINVDNSGTHLTKYTGLVQNAVLLENEIREQLVQVLKTKDDDLLKKILLNPKYKFNLDKYSKLSGSLQDIVKAIVEDRMLCKLDSKKDLISQLESKPITAAVVVMPKPEHVGGGLHINSQTGQMAVVDKVSMSANQSKNKDYEFYFNPVLYSTYINRPMSNNLEKTAIFSVMKSPGGIACKQGESARTHIATDPNAFMKRMIIVPENKLETAFKQLKTYDETSIDRNRDLTKIIEEQIFVIAQNIGKTPTQVAQALKSAQEITLNHLKEVKMGKKPQIINIDPNTKSVHLHINLNLPQVPSVA